MIDSLGIDYFLLISDVEEGSQVLVQLVPRDIAQPAGIHIHVLCSPCHLSGIADH